MSESDDELLRTLLAGTQRRDLDSTVKALNGLTPPALCKIMIGLVSADRKEMMEIRKLVEDKFTSSALRKERIQDQILTGVILAIVLAGLKSLGVW